MNACAHGGYVFTSNVDGQFQKARHRRQCCHTHIGSYMHINVHMRPKTMHQTHTTNSPSSCNGVPGRHRPCRRVPREHPPCAGASSAECLSVSCVEDDDIHGAIRPQSTVHAARVNSFRQPPMRRRALGGQRSRRRRFRLQGTAPTSPLSLPLNPHRLIPFSPPRPYRRLRRT